MEIKKGKYEIFIVGDEKVFSESREKIKNYAREKGIDKITYKMSVDTKEGAQKIGEYIS